MPQQQFRLPDVGEGLTEADILRWDVAVGDTVLYSKYGGTEVKYRGEEYLILNARDVLAVLEK